MCFEGYVEQGSRYDVRMKLEQELTCVLIFVN